MTQNNLYMEDDNLRLYVDVQPLFIDELENKKNAAAASAQSAAQSASNAQTWLNNIISYKTNLELFYAQSINNLTDWYNNATASLNNLFQQMVASIQNYVNQAKSYAEEAQRTIDSRVSLEHLNQSKALETGDVSDDGDVLPWIINLAHSTFDASKFTVVGSPNVTDDGIASGFSSSNYLKSPFPDVTSKNYRIDFEITYKAASSIQIFQAIFSDIPVGNASRRIALRIFNNRLQLSLSSNGSSWNIGEKYSSLSLTNGKDYKISFVRSATNYKVLVTNIETNIEQEYITFDTTADLYNTSHQCALGYHYTSSIDTAFLGSIDLKQFSITVDGVPVFSGNKTGIDTIKPDDYTVVGSPTISADGVVSGFSSSDYTKTSIDFSSAQTWELQIPFKTGSSLMGQTIIDRNAYESQNYIYLYVDYNYFKPRLNIGGENIISDTVGANFFACTTNTNYIVKIGYDGTNYYIKKVVNGVETLVNTITSSSTLSINKTVRFGETYAGNSPFGGSIDMNGVKFIKNGDLQLQGCLKLPYTQSKTGSKVVDAIYRPRVNDMAEQFGYANYYTLDGNNGNFTLPKGELYGMIEKLREFIIQRTT